MSVCRKLPDGTIQKIAGHTILLDANVSEIRQGTFNIQGVAGTDTSVQVTFSDPMPDTDYVVIYEYHSWGGYPVNTEPSPVTCISKTTTGFTARLWCFADMSGPMIIKYTAFKLVKLDGYTELQNKVNNPDSTPTEDSLNFVTSGGVYDAILSASKIFINSESAWNELDAETKATYQVAILTDKPTVNAVNSTNGSTTVVGEPNKRWIGTQAEWGNLTTAEKAKYEIVCFNDDNGESGKDIYSTTETKTNKVWIDGKPIYRKVFTDIPFPEEVDIVQANTAAVIRNTDAFPVNYISDIVSASFVAINRTSGNQCNLPRRWNTTDPETGESMIAVIDASINSQGENRVYELEVRSNRTSWSNTTYKARAIIEYTKVGD